MTTSQKTILVGLGIVMAAFIALAICPLFSEIQRESHALVFQKTELAELEQKIQNLNEFQKSRQSHQDNLDKIEELLISSSEPVNFIEFLEEEARKSELGIEILPFVPEKGGKPWSSMNFKLTLVGSFDNFLEFLEKLESAPYLIEILSLNAFKRGEEGPGTEIMVLIKVYAKD